MIGKINALEVAEKVLNHMLAPSSVMTSDNDMFRIVSTSYLEMRLRWNINCTFTTPGMFLSELEALLRPISEAITYGEVVDLRDEVKRLKEMAARDKETIADLKRYRDAVEIMGGRVDKEKISENLTFSPEKRD